MKKFLVFVLALVVLASACGKKEAEAPAAPAVNPFLTEWTAPFGTPPFGEIKEAHFMPAFQEGMARQKAEVAAITVSRARLSAMVSGTSP